MSFINLHPITKRPFCQTLCINNSFKRTILEKKEISAQFCSFSIEIKLYFHIDFIMIHFPVKIDK